MSQSNDNKLKKKRKVYRYYLAQNAKQKQNSSTKAAQNEKKNKNTNNQKSIPLKTCKNRINVCRQMVTGKQNGKSIKQRNQTQRDKRLFKSEENKDEKKSRRKTLVEIELPGRTTEYATPGKSKKVILHIPDAKSKQPTEFFCKISDPKNERKMNDRIATESNTKNAPADINTLKTSNRRKHRNKRPQNFERPKVNVEFENDPYERRSMSIRDCSNRLEACRAAIARKQFIRRTCRNPKTCSTRTRHNSKNQKHGKNSKKKRNLKRTYMARRRARRIRESRIRNRNPTKNVSMKSEKRYRKRNLRKDIWSCFNPRFVPIVTRSMSRSYNSWKQNMGVNNSELHNISFAAALFGSGNPNKACPEAQTVESQNVTNPRWISYSPMNRFVTHQSFSKFGHLPTLKQGESLKTSQVIPSSSIPLSNYNQIPYFNFENSNRCNQVINFFTTPLSSKSGKGPFGTLELKGNANVGQESSQVKIKDNTIKIRRKSFSETRIVTDFDKKSVFSVKTTTWKEATVIAQEENEASNLIQSLAAVKNTSTSTNSNGSVIKIEISSGKRNYTERCQSSPEVVNKSVELKPSYPSSTKDSEKLKENIMEEIHEERRLLLEEIKKFFAFYHPEYENAGLKGLPNNLKLMNDNKKSVYVSENNPTEFNFRNQTEVMLAKKSNEEISKINLEHISVPILDKLPEREDNVVECDKPKVSDDGFQNSLPFVRNVKETGSKEEIMQPEVPPLTFTNLLLNDQLCNLEANRNKKTFLLKSFKGITANQDRNSEPFSVESADVGHFILNNSNRVQNNTACLPLLSNPTHQTNEKSVENEDRKDLCENLNLSKLEEQENWKNTNVPNDASPSSFIPAPQRGKMIEVSTSSSEFWELDSWLTSTSESLSNGTFGSNASDTTNAIHFSSNGDKKSFENILGPRRETLGMENIRSESDEENRKSFESYESRSASSIDILSRALNANLSMSECADKYQKNSSFALSDTTGESYPKRLSGRDYMYLNMPLNCSRNDENKIYNYTRLNSGKLGENPNFSTRPKSKKVNNYLNNKLDFPIPSSTSGTSENLSTFTFSTPIYNFIDSSDVCDSNSCSNTVEEFSEKNNSFSKWCYDYDSSYCKTNDSFVSSNSTQNFVLLQDSPRPYGSEMTGDACSSNLSNLNLSVSSLNVSVESISSQNSASDSCLVTSSSSEDENEQKLEQKQLKFGEPRTATTSTEFSKEAILSSEEDGSFGHRTAKPFANSLLNQTFSKDFSNNRSRESKRMSARKTINKKKFENGCLYWLKQKRMKKVNHNDSIEYIPISISKKNNCKCRSLKIKFIMPSKAPKSPTGDQRKNYVNTSANHKGPSPRKQKQENGDPHSAGDVCNGFCSQEIKKVLLEQLSTNEVLSQIGLRVCAYETPVEVLVSTPKKNNKSAYHKILTLCGYED